MPAYGYEQLHPIVLTTSRAFVKRLAFASFAVLGLFGACLMYKQDHDNSLLHWPRLRGRQTWALPSFAVSGIDTSPFGIFGHPSAEDKAARAMVKQASKKETISMELKPSALLRPINLDEEMPVRYSSTTTDVDAIGTTGTFQAVYNSRPQFSGHLDDDERVARAIEKQETKKENIAHSSWTFNLSEEGNASVNENGAFELLGNSSELPPSGIDDVASSQELNFSSEFTRDNVELLHNNQLEVFSSPNLLTQTNLEDTP